jgi:hypothetical protein
VAEVRVSLPELHPGQVRRRQKIAATKARFVVTMCGRRWGKSMDAIEWVCDGALEGESCALMAPTYKYLLELWRDVTKRLRPLAEQGGRVSEQEHRIDLPNGGVVECWSLESPDPGRGRKYHRVAIDEAGLIAGLEDIVQQAIRPTLVDYRGSCWLYGTPKGRKHGFVVLFAKGEQGENGWLSFRAPTRDNPYIPADEIEAARREMPPAIFAQEFEGIPADDGANPFGLDAIRACIAPLSELPPIVYGWDFARAQDWTVGIGLDKHGTVSRFHRWQHRPWKESLDDVCRLNGATMAYGDSTGIGDVLVEDIQRREIPMAGVSFSRSKKQQMMERLRSMIQLGQLRFPDGPIVTELSAFEFEYIADGKGGVRYVSPIHDDTVMALALACQGYFPVSDEAQRFNYAGETQGPYDFTAPNPAYPDGAERGKPLRLRARRPTGQFFRGKGSGITLNTGTL